MWRFSKRDKKDCSGPPNHNFVANQFDADAIQANETTHRENATWALGRPPLLARLRETSDAGS